MVDGDGDGDGDGEDDNIGPSQVPQLPWTARIKSVGEPDWIGLNCANKIASKLVTLKQFGKFDQISAGN